MSLRKDRNVHSLFLAPREVVEKLTGGETLSVGANEVDTRAGGLLAHGLPPLGSSTVLRRTELQRRRRELLRDGAIGAGWAEADG